MENRKVAITRETVTIFLDSLANIDPKLWVIKQYLVKFNINPDIIPLLIENLAKVNEIGYGKVTTEVSGGKISMIRTETNIKPMAEVVGE